MSKNHLERAARLVAALDAVSQEWLHGTPPVCGLHEAWPVLYIRHLGDGVPEQELRTVVAAADLDAALGVLVASDLVVRRGEGLHLTSAGRALAVRIDWLVRGLEQVLRDRVSEPDLDATLRVLRALQASPD